MHTAASPIEAISVKETTKSFGSSASRTIALRGICVDFNLTDSYALLGENGAGKTTLLRLLVGLMRPNEGTITVFGHNPILMPVATRKRVAYLPASSRLYERMTGNEILVYYGQLEGQTKREAQQRAVEVVSSLKSCDLLARPYGVLSTGQRRRIELARALMGRPSFLILDEPFSGLDISSRENLIEHLAKVKSSGINLIISSHITAGLDRLCSWIVLLHGYSGDLVARSRLQRGKEG